jgi:rhamnose transport system permease protein
VTTLTAPGTLSSPLRHTLAGLLRSREIAIAVVAVLVVAVTTAKNHQFLFAANGWRDLLLTPSILLLLAVGETAVVITRSVDLSIGSVVGLTAYLTGRLFIAHPGLPVGLVFLIGLAAGGVLGLVNGVLVAFGRVPALVITLGTMYVYRGIFLTWAGSNRVNASDLPDSFLRLGTQQVLTIPVLTIIAVVVLAVAGYYLYSARGGRELYAIGSDPDAARLYGLRVTRRVLTAFVLSGAMAGLAGVATAARYGTVSANAGLNLELQAVGAAVIGGVAIFGGSGTVWGAALGAFLLVTINRALPVIGVQDFWQQFVVGAMIIGAIVLDRVLSIRRDRKIAAATSAARAAARGNS